MKELCDLGHTLNFSGSQYHLPFVKLRVLDHLPATGYVHTKVDET